MGAKDPAKWRDVDVILQPLMKLPFNTDTAMEAAKIFQLLQKQGNIIEFRDIFIAATAITNNLPIKTLNTKDFSKVPGLLLV
jgi:predicted nucleic acid-binding protein